MTKHISTWCNLSSYSGWFFQRSLMALTTEQQACQLSCIRQETCDLPSSPTLWVSCIKSISIYLFSSYSYWNVSMYPFLHSLKLFHIDNCQYIAVGTVANNNFISYLKRYFSTVWCKFRKYAIPHVFPPILSKRLTALEQWLHMFVPACKKWLLFRNILVKFTAF